MPRFTINICPAPSGQEHLTNPDFWRRVIDIPDDALWETHQQLKLRLTEFVRARVRLQRERIGEPPEKIRHVTRLLNPEILTVGFARRFATYKRGTLLFSDPDRLLKMINNTERPVQFIFAGKSHPKDEGGKKLIQEVYKFSRDPLFENRIVFVEDYDHYIGRRLYQGVDLWLNNPLRPLEASGTSGMKLPPNGGLNLSVLDGWWCEGYNGKNGWAIGARNHTGAASSCRTKWTSRVSTICSRRRSSRSTTPSPTAACRSPGSSSCANPSAASRRFSTRTAW